MPISTSISDESDGTVAVESVDERTNAQKLSTIAAEGDIDRSASVSGDEQRANGVANDSRSKTDEHGQMISEFGDHGRTVLKSIQLPCELPSFLTSSVRLKTKRTSPLSPLSTFSGSQQSGRSTYEVNVQLIHVDLENAFLCGYLEIQNLTREGPIKTYFEGEIISEKHSFLTRKVGWGATEKTDLQHWTRLSSDFRPIAKSVKSRSFIYQNFMEKTHMFMRWKELFLAGDHRVQRLTGASFAGFYYVVLNQGTGHLSGYYYHPNSEMFQQLELNWDQAPQKTTFEFR